VISPSCMTNDAIGHTQHLVLFRTDDDDTGAFCDELVYELVDFDLGAHVDAARWFVEMKILAFETSHFGMTTFCWFRPRAWFDQHVHTGGLQTPDRRTFLAAVSFIFFMFSQPYVRTSASAQLRC